MAEIKPPHKTADGDANPPYSYGATRMVHKQNVRQDPTKAKPSTQPSISSQRESLSQSSHSSQLTLEQECEISGKR